MENGNPVARGAGPGGIEVGDLHHRCAAEVEMAGLTGLEPATSCVTGRRSNRLNYNPTSPGAGLPAPKSRGRIAGGNWGVNETACVD